MFTLYNRAFGKRNVLYHDTCVVSLGSLPERFFILSFSYYIVVCVTSLRIRRHGPCLEKFKLLGTHVPFCWRNFENLLNEIKTHTVEEI